MNDENFNAKSGDLTKSASALIKKISNAVGGIFKPPDVVRAAEAKAELTRMDAQGQETDLRRRAIHRLVEEEARYQSNIEGITGLALPFLKNESSPLDVEDDWITNFFDKSRIISDSEMQQVWSRLLAGEANTPGTFSKRTVNLLADLDKSDAELFVRLCGFNWVIENYVPLIFDFKSDVYNREGINFNSLSHLETLGLVRFNNVNHYVRLRLPKKVVVFYHGQPIELTLQNEDNNELDVGTVLFTKAGQQLALICGATPVEGFFDYIHDKWVSQGLAAKRETEPIVSEDPPRESH